MTIRRLGRRPDRFGKVRESVLRQLHFPNTLYLSGPLWLAGKSVATFPSRVTGLSTCQINGYGAGILEKST
jgi:hypothetical protein